MNLDTFAGLPLHVLLVHAVVVGVPLASLAVMLHALWPAARRRLGIVTPLAGLLLVALVPVTVQAGQKLEPRVPATQLLNQHIALGDTLLPWVIGLFAIGVLEWVWFRFRDRVPALSAPPVRLAITVVVAVVAVAVAVGSTVDVVLIGDAGARAVWHGVAG
ncbi:MAG: hypothetical protein JWR33_2199 [Naasia sp.]|jgi:hypothetical protein|uniref:DUF2231 domain-containing protein n=1 Tax=Naasia sp. TaxID=2546198 RepID=UPI0026287835|nr:DUF2231 domain-containing protein [Naasia sp.]MCU1571458.1 hypothetical protein [Naasia sp.]